MNIRLGIRHGWKQHVRARPSREEYSDRNVAADGTRGSPAVAVAYRGEYIREGESLLGGAVHACKRARLLRLRPSRLGRTLPKESRISDQVHTTARVYVGEGGSGSRPSRVHATTFPSLILLIRPPVQISPRSTTLASAAHRLRKVGLRPGTTTTTTTSGRRSSLFPFVASAKSMTLRTASESD